MTFAIETVSFPNNGWAQIEHMVDLLCQLGGAEVTEVGKPRWPKLTLRLSRAGKRAPEANGLIFIARGPLDISAALHSQRFRKPAAFRAIWVIDSFWTERFPHAASLNGFDAVGFSQSYDADFFADLVGERALHLPWGSDVLGLGSENPDRKTDLLRVGRQPDAWNDDEANAASAQALSLAYNGRPPFKGVRSERQKSLMTEGYAQAKFVLAHSNLVDDATYTHPHKEYITARWTDALASGASIVGQQPQTDLGQIDWPEATLDLEAGSREEQFEVVREAVAAWTPARAARNYENALARLDWRWRFLTLLGAFDAVPEALNADIARMTSILAERTPPASPVT